jgi:DNA-binding IclR family transcriptional regulator
MDDHTVTGRVVAVLDAVAGHDHAVSLAELTRAVGIPKPTVRRIAADLVSRRMLERCDDGRYRLGSRLQALGMRAVAQQGLVQAAMPHVQDLFARTREIVWISAVADDTIIIVDSTFGANRAQDMQREWPEMDSSSTTLHATAAGRLLLADQPAIVEHLRARPLRPSTPYTTTSWQRLAAELEAIRDTSIAAEYEQSTIGYSCVATGIRNPEGSLIGIIGVTGRTGRLHTQRLIRPLLAAAQDAARTLAGNSEPAGSEP